MRMNERCKDGEHQRCISVLMEGLECVPCDCPCHMEVKENKSGWICREYALLQEVEVRRPVGRRWQERINKFHEALGEHQCGR